MPYLVNLGLRAAEFFWSLLIMALVGNMIATSFAGNPSIVNYDLFVSLFAMLSLFYLIFAGLKEGWGVPIVSIALDVLNTLFFLCGGIATAAYLGAHSCSNDVYTATNRITNGSPDRMKRCREAQASTAFLWFGFACFAASTFFSAMEGRGNVNMRGIGMRRSSPSMSQV